MKYKTLRNLLVSCAALGLAQSAYSQLPNATTWTPLGQVNDYNGNTAGIFSSDEFGFGTTSASNISTFFGGTFLPDNIEGPPTDGSAIKTTFTAPGSQVTLAYQVITNETVGSGWDHAFLFLDGNTVYLGLNSNSLAQSPGLLSGRPNAAGAAAAAPLTILTIVGLAPGTHTLGFGVYDTGDEDTSSGVLISTLPNIGGALELAVEQREVLLGAVQTSTRDVGGRLFSLRAEADENDEGVTTLALVDGGKGARDGKDSKDSKEIKVAPERPTVEFYGQGAYGYGDRNDVSLADFVSNTYVGSAGVEVHLNKHLTLGLAYSHIENRTDFGNNIGKLRLRGDAITPYFSYVQNHFYTEALYSYSKFDDQVNVTGAGQATPASENHTVKINIGYNLNFGKLVTGPFAAVDYTAGGLDGFGVGGNTVVMGKQSYDSLITSVGWQASYKVNTSFGSITPQLRASWDRENLDNSDTVSASLPGVQTQTLNAGTGVLTNTGAFTGNANTIQSGRDYLNAGAGVLVNLGTRGSLILDYEDHLFRSSYSERFASVQVGIKF